MKWIRSIQNEHGRLGRWSILFQSYDFDVQHLSGKSNVVADALSRRQYPDHDEATPPDDDDYELNCISVDSTGQSNEQNNAPEVTEYCLKYEPLLEPLTTINELREPQPIDKLPDIAIRQNDDSQLKQIIDYLRSGKLPDDDTDARHIILESQDYIIEHDVLYHLFYPRGKGPKAERLIKQLVVPQLLRNDVLLSNHDTLTGGHQRMERTYHNIRQKYFWPRMFSDIESYVTSYVRYANRSNEIIMLCLHHCNHSQREILSVGHISTS